MSRLLALEWDAKEARVVVGRKRGAAVVVEQAFSAPLPQREEGSTAEADVGGAIAKSLTEHGQSRVDALVAVGRASIELRFLSTPPVPPEELPELVRFQALRQFTTLGDDWPLDYVPLSPNADGGNNVLAAAIAPELVGQIRQTCAAAGVNVSRLVLRPFAAAAVLQDQLDDGQCRMIVDLLRDDADLTVLIGPQVIFPRTVRLPTVSEPAALARALLAEGRRTMIAAQNQLGGRRVEEVVIFGDGQHHSTLKALLEKELSLTVRLVDPFERFELSGEATFKRPEDPGTFAPLLGMLLDEAAGRPPVIDFLHPRKKAEPPNRRRTYMLIGSAVAAVILLALFAMQMRLWSMDDHIKELARELAKQKKAAEASAEPVADAKYLESFAAGDVTWLDELGRMSMLFPGSDAARVDDFKAQIDVRKGAGGGGSITLTGVVDKSDRIKEIEDSLRDKLHSVNGDGGTQNYQLQGLQWQFNEHIAVAPPTAGLAPAAAAKQAPPARLPAARQGGAK